MDSIKVATMILNWDDLSIPERVQFVEKLIKNYGSYLNYAAATPSERKVFWRYWKEIAKAMGDIENVAN